MSKNFKMGMRQAFQWSDDMLEYSEQEGMWENRKLKDVADLSCFYFYVRANSSYVKSTYLPDWTAILLNNTQSVVMNRDFNSKQQKYRNSWDGLANVTQINYKAVMKQPSL